MFFLDTSGSYKINAKMLVNRLHCASACSLEQKKEEAKVTFGDVDLVCVNKRKLPMSI